MIKKRRNMTFQSCDSIGTVLLSCDAKHIICGNIFSIRWRQLKQGMEWIIRSSYHLGTNMSITWHWWHCQWQYFVCLVKINETRCNMTFWVMWYQCLVSHDTNSIINNTIEFVSSRWSKWDSTWLFSVIWHCWHWYQHHVMPMALSITPLHSLGQHNWNNMFIYVTYGNCLMYITHYWQMPPKKYVSEIAHVCLILFLLKSTYRCHITAHIHQNLMTCTCIYQILPNMCKY